MVLACCLHAVSVVVESSLCFSVKKKKEIMIQKKLISFLHMTVGKILIKPESTTIINPWLKKKKVALPTNTHLEVKKKKVL